MFSPAKLRETIQSLRDDYRDTKGNVASHALRYFGVTNNPKDAHNKKYAPAHQFLKEHPHELLEIVGQWICEEKLATEPPASIVDIFTSAKIIEETLTEEQLYALESILLFLHEFPLETARRWLSTNIHCYPKYLKHQIEMTGTYQVPPRAILGGLQLNDKSYPNLEEHTFRGLTPEQLAPLYPQIRDLLDSLLDKVQQAINLAGKTGVLEHPQRALKHYTKTVNRLAAAIAQAYIAEKLTQQANKTNPTKRA